METKSKTSLGTKLEYGFCILGGLYFIGRFIAGVAFNV
jgi:hypothetical protein